MPEEYIDREKAQNAIREQIIHEDTAYVDALIFGVTLIQGVPTADVAPVNHQRWIENESTGDWFCSGCGRICADDHAECPYCHCGARMDAKEDAHDDQA